MVKEPQLYTRRGILITIAGLVFRWISSAVNSRFVYGDVAGNVKTTVGRTDAAWVLGRSQPKNVRGPLCPLMGVGG